MHNEHTPSSRTCYRCYRCCRERPLSAFTQRVDDRHYAMCRVCVSEILAARTGRKKRLSHSATERTCYLCLRVLAVERFTRRRNGTYFSACKDCNRHVFGQRRRARLKRVGGAYSVAEWQALVALYDACPMCRRGWSQIPMLPGATSVITVDHIVPISKGGSNIIDNLQPLFCWSCNSKKGAKVNPPAKRK